MKILFALILCIIFLVCFISVLFGGKQNPALIALTPFSFIAFFGYFAAQFLNLDINLPNIGIRKRVLDLEKQHQELRKIATALFKLSLSTLGYAADTEKVATQIISLAKELGEYLDKDDIKLFLKNR